MLIFFFLVHFTPCNVGLYSPAGGKNELEEKKKSTLQEVSQTKKIIEEKPKSPTLQGINLFTLFFSLLPFSFAKQTQH
jgi:hypothetical protein